MVNDVRFEIIRDDGKVFIIDDSVWRIPNEGLDGWHDLDVSIGTLDNVIRDGGIVTNQRVGMVYRTITAELRDIQANQVGRRQAESFFLPKRSYTVKATYMGRTRKCDGVQSKFTMSQGNVYQPVTFAWTILCADPYMTTPESVESTIGFKSEPRFGFPYVSLANRQDDYNKGFITGLGKADENQFAGNLNRENVMIITNDGDVEVAPRFVVQLKEMQQTNKIDIKVRKLSKSYSEGITTWSWSSYAVRVNDVSYGMNGLYGTVFYEMVIDLAKRPFGVYFKNSRLQFELADDSLLKNPLIGSGESCYEITIYDKTGEIVPRDDYSFRIYLDPKFTGV